MSMIVANPVVQLNREFLDTNIYFSAFSNPGGVPFEVWHSALCGCAFRIVEPLMASLDLDALLRVSIL
jgi:hypothetical protein